MSAGGTLTLINTNRMAPPIGPIGLDYVAGAVRQSGGEVDILDLCLADDPPGALARYFESRSPSLVGITFRNVDDCFWPSAESFLPQLKQILAEVRRACGAPIVLGGVGFSIFAERIVECTGADFGIRGDGEEAVVALLAELAGDKRFRRVPGLLWRDDGRLIGNAPAWPKDLSLTTARDSVDNAAYFEKGGQCGLETKRGCNRHCVYCADALAKGPTVRTRSPSEVADEVEALLAQGIDVLHLCDAEFNVPRDHAVAVCTELVRRSLGRRLRWYTYMTVVPFDAELAGLMRQAGCVGIDFTGDSACQAMLRAYGHQHGREDLASAVALCRDNGIAVMIDLLLGGPGETPETVAETIDFIKQIDPDCAGAALGIRIYPGTPMADRVRAEAPAEDNPAIRRRYEGPVDFFRPTFYIAAALGDRPAKRVQDLIAGDERFFEPTEPLGDPTDQGDVPRDHNYNDNTALVNAIAEGSRGAYWHILRQLR